MGPPQKRMKIDPYHQRQNAGQWFYFLKKYKVNLYADICGASSGMGRQTTTTVFGYFGGYFFGHFRDKKGIITWR